ncbi:MAG: hypothetical protein ABIR70_07125 [Bryobacteraceae bacterium]
MFDANILSIAIHAGAGIPKDYRTGDPIDRARERVWALIARVESEGECVLLPAPALGEALTSVAEHAERYIEEIERNSCFRIHPFGKREAIEIAMRTKAAIKAGDKKEGLSDSPWQKVKYDRQIVATAKTEGVTAIYSTDKHIHAHAKLWQVPVIHLADVMLTSAGVQTSLLEEESAAGDADPADNIEEGNGTSAQSGSAIDPSWLSRTAWYPYIRCARSGRVLQYTLQRIDQTCPWCKQLLSQDDLDWLRRLTNNPAMMNDAEQLFLVLKNGSIDGGSISSPVWDTCTGAIGAAHPAQS